MNPRMDCARRAPQLWIECVGSPPERIYGFEELDTSYTRKGGKGKRGEAR